MKSVLVIDDEPAIRTVLKRVLEQAGHTVRLASNGVEGLESLEAEFSEVVITDIIMPTMHGVDAIKAIAQKYPTVRIVAISGGGNFGNADYQPHAIKTEAYLAAAKLAGAHAVLNKPFHSRDVLQAIATATGSSE